MRKFECKRKMGIRNYLIEGVSGTGKTSVCDELQRRGYHAIHGDRELAYQGDPQTGEPTDSNDHEHHIWNVEKVRSFAANHDYDASFFCGGSRNFDQFIDLFDLVFILDVDPDILNQRLCRRSEDEFGGKPFERDIIMRLQATKEDLPKDAIMIDAKASISCVVNEILCKCGTLEQKT